MSVNEYDPNAPLPKPGSRWVWEIDRPHARTLLEVEEAFWNGEQWWVRTKALLPAEPRTFASQRCSHLNELGRFWEAVTPVGHSKAKLTEYRPRDAAQAVES